MRFLLTTALWVSSGLAFARAPMAGPPQAQNALKELVPEVAAARVNIGAYAVSNPAGHVNAIHAGAAAPVPSTFGCTGAVSLLSSDVNGTNGLLSISNLVDTGSASSMRINLGFGGASVLNVGTAAGILAAADDQRITGHGSVHTADQRGVDRTGAIDSLVGVNAAGASATVSGGPLVFDPGTYKLSGYTANLTNQIYEFIDVAFPGSTGYVAGMGDASPLISGLAHGRVLSNDTSPLNRFTTYTGLTIGVTGAAVPYQKAAIYGFSSTSDPSTYSGSGTSWTPLVTKDGGVAQLTATIAKGNMTGRAYALTVGCKVGTGADGACGGIEVDSINDPGIDQPYFDQPTTKISYSAVAIGGTPTTAAYVVAKQEAAHYHDGFVVRQNAVSGNAFRVLATGSLTTDTARISSAGDGLVNSLSITGGAIGTPAGAMTLGTAGGYQFQIGSTASAVNRMVALGGVAGQPTTLTTVGTDATPGLTIKPLGSLTLGGTSVVSTVGLTAASFTSTAGDFATPASTMTFATSGGDQMQLGNIASAVNRIVIHGSVTGQPATISTTGSDPTQGLFVSPSGTLTLGGTSIALNSALFGSSLSMTGGASVGLDLTVKRHIIGVGGVAPAVSPGALISGSNDTRGAVTLAAGTTASTVTFRAPYSSAPFCVLTGSSTANVKAVTAISTTVLMIGMSANLAGETVYWQCMQ